MWTVIIDEGANYPVPGAASGTARAEMSQIQVPALKNSQSRERKASPLITWLYRCFIMWMEGSWGALILS